MTTTIDTPAGAIAGFAERTSPDTLGDRTRGAAEGMLSAANDAVARLPAAAATTRDAIAEASRTIQTESNERLSAGTLLSFGFAMGLLIGGANRLLVLLALIPATAMGVTLLDRGWRRHGRR